ncbi:hypothetical protein KBX50_24885 [Micromonospora sp. C51]|uniref:hypothetical protein n=1 Tax=Micromonospora sp. C51 TaxID=2824879 RepID=UPI001B38573D|nr:hypothetical protein [Micromonospora sp. C51]MBQ1051690.1 hypothetical protein [Micromonospora sp. C51]
MNPQPTTGTRIEGLVLVLILLTVAGFAGAASFTHVKDWTLANSPTGTGEWFGWANAVISELVPIACLLTIRRRRRVGAPIGYPLFLLIAAASLSLAAQLAVAKPGVSGWLLSAVPALAFMALVKLVLAPTKGSTTPPSTPVEPVERAEPIHVQAAEQATTEPPAAITASDPTPAPTPVPTVEPLPTPEPVTVPAVEPVDVPTHLLPMARFSAVQHEQATGRPITADELADRLDITPTTAGYLLAALNGGAQ